VLNVTSRHSTGTGISGILLWTREPLVREPGLLRKYEKEEEEDGITLK
jgi:hypothetical protein